MDGWTTVGFYHPEWLALVDKVGSNTSQAKDGNVGGEIV
jgi:hypothetical protein